jgi:AGCS family alanine or glycine:cation symporter
MDLFNSILGTLNGILWHNIALYIVLASGVLFTFWSGFSQYRALTHGTRVITGKYDQEGGQGAITHFQALSAALSATVGLGNIAGVAIAIALGGPGAVLWMWIVGFLGMALKSTEVTLAMLHRNTDDPNNPHGGTMWILRRTAEQQSGALKAFGLFMAGVFCICVLAMGITGGNMFQAWSVGDITQTYIGVPPWVSGTILAVVVGVTIIGGVKRIGQVASLIVPIMCGIYVVAGLFVVFSNIGELPSILSSIFTSAFSGTEAQGAFIGGSAGYAFMWGMKRALFSSEAGMGSAPIAHSAVKTKEPVREGVVAGLEPFIDTLVVCSITAFVLLSTGMWNRDADLQLSTAPSFEQTATSWQASPSVLPDGHGLAEGTGVFLIAAADANVDTGSNQLKVSGTVNGNQVAWNSVDQKIQPTVTDTGVYANYIGATLTAKAFDTSLSGLGWVIFVAVWFFAISTMISWSYYGEQATIYLFGNRGVTPYRVIYCLLAIVACSGIVKTTVELDNISALGAGMMLWVNIPVTLILGYKAMSAYKAYIARLKAGEFE